MSRMHAWKGRHWGQDYPYENGNPFQDAAGDPIYPVGKEPEPDPGSVAAAPKLPKKKKKTT